MRITSGNDLKTKLPQYSAKTMSSSLWTTEANGYLTFCVSVAFLYSVIFCFFNCDFRKKYEGKTGIGLNDYFCIGTNRRKHEKTLDRLHRITYRRPDRIPLHPLLLRFGEGVKSGELNYVVYKGLVFKTYEGKLIQSGIRSKTAGTIQSYEFEFSVENEALARKLMLLGGKNIELHYKEYFGALPWRGFSKFVVDSIVTKPIGSLPIDSETER